MGYILLYGYGNPGRQDDGYGYWMIQAAENWNMDGVACRFNYQLNIEDAEEISRYRYVIFIDAGRTTPEPFSFYPLKMEQGVSCTTHSMHPSVVLSLCRRLYNKAVIASVLEIRGYKWDLSEKMSGKGKRNFHKAEKFLYNYLIKQRCNIRDYAPEGERS